MEAIKCGKKKLFRLLNLKCSVFLKDGDMKSAVEGEEGGYLQSLVIGLLSVS